MCIRDRYRIDPNLKYVIYCSTKAYPKQERVKTYKGHRLIYVPLNANGYQAVIYDNICTIHAWFTCSCLLSLGTAAGLSYSFLRWFKKSFFIVNLDGLDHKREKWSKYQKTFMSFTRKLAVNLADEVISDNAVIKRNIQEEYNIESNLIEYGGDNASKVFDLKALSKYDLVKGAYFFSVARIEPENNTHLILEAFENTKEEIVFIGNWSNSQYGKELLEKYKDKSNYRLFHPIYDATELNLIRSNCKVYIHGHSKGGTNPSLVEAMSLRLAIFAYEVNYNIETTESGCLYFKDSNSLKQLVEEITLEEINTMSLKAEEIAKRRYTWKSITEKYETLFKKSKK